MKQLLIASLLLLMLGCSNKITVQKFGNQATVNESFFYTLPANTFDVEVKIKKEKFERGNFFDTRCEDFIRIAADSFGLDKDALGKLKTSSAYTKYSLVEDAFAWTEGAVPDTNKIFVLLNKPSWLKDNSFAFNFNRDWMISSATLSTENKTFEIITTFLSTATGTASALFKSNKASETAPALSVACSNIFKQLIELKEQYQQFQLNPPANLNAEALQMSKAAQLKRIEKKIEDLFYKKTEEISVVKFSIYIPSAIDGTSTTKFFKIDNSTGKVIINSVFQPYVLGPKIGKVQFAAAAPADAGYYSIMSEPNLNSVQFKINGQLPAIAVGQETGIVYNVPKMMNFYLINDANEVLARSSVPVAQFGGVNTLSQKASKADFTLDSLTGSLTKITLESKSVASDRIKTVGSLVQQVDSSLKKKTEMDKLEEKAKELELRAKIKEFEAKLQ